MADQAQDEFNTSDLPKFDEAGIAAVRLLQGAVYHTDTQAWDLLLANRTRIESHFAFIGMCLVVDESEGYAYLRPISEEDQVSDGYGSLPKLFRQTRLGFGATVLCVLLRDHLRRFDDEELNSTRCVIRREDLYEEWAGMVPASNNETKTRSGFQSALNTLRDLGFVKPLRQDSDDLEIRRILKARVTLGQLEELRQQLVEQVDSGEEEENG